MKEKDLGHWGRLPPGRLPPKTVRDKLDILGLAMGWGNGLGVIGMYLTGREGEKEWAGVEHLITRGVARMALNWGLEERERKEKENGKSA